MENDILNIMNWLGIPATVIGIISLVIKSNPITLMTSNNFERKLYSKERILIYKIIYYILLVLLIGFFVYFFSFAISQSKIVARMRFLSITFYIAIVMNIWMYYVMYRPGSIEKFRNQLNKITSNSDIFIGIYVSYWIMSLGVFFGTNTSMQSLFNQGGQDVQYGILIPIVTVACLFQPLVINPIIIIFRFNIMKNFIINIGDSKWYLLNLINNDQYLLGDNNEFEKCKKIRIIKKEDLVNKNIEVVKP